MTKIERVQGTSLLVAPLRITRRKAKGTKAASFRVGCGCCNAGLVIFPSTGDPEDMLIEINGVIGSKSQWQQIFGPLLDMKPKTAR